MWNITLKCNAWRIFRKRIPDNHKVLIDVFKMLEKGNDLLLIKSGGGGGGGGGGLFLDFCFRFVSLHAFRIQYHFTAEIFVQFF